MDINKMLRAKNKSVKGLTMGIEGLFKKNNVTYVKGAGKITSAKEVTVDLIEGGTETVGAVFFQLHVCMCACVSVWLVLAGFHYSR